MANFTPITETVRLNFAIQQSNVTGESVEEAQDRFDRWKSREDIAAAQDVLIEMMEDLGHDELYTKFEIYKLLRLKHAEVTQRLDATNGTE